MGTGRPPGNYNPHDKNGRFTKGQQYTGPLSDTHYGFKDKVVRSKVEYATDTELLQTRDEELRERQIARNKAEAEQRAFDESMRWARNTLTKEEKDLQERIKKAEDALRRNPNNKQIQDFYTRQRNSLQIRLNTSMGKRALKYRNDRRYK